MSKTTKVVDDGEFRLLVQNILFKGPMTNEQLGEFTKRTDEIKRRITEGTLPFGRVIVELQAIVEGQVITREKLKDVLNHACPNASFEVRDLLRTIGQKFGVIVE